MVCMNAVGRKNIDSAINTDLAHSIYVQMKDIKSAPGYPGSQLLYYNVIFSIVMHNSGK